MNPYLQQILANFSTRIAQLETENKALHNLVQEQDKKIIDLAFRAVYAERSAEIAYNPKKHGLKE